MEQQHGLRRAPRQTKKRDSFKGGGSVRATVRSSTPLRSMNKFASFALMPIIFRIHQGESMFSGRVLEMGPKARFR